ncbi:MAG: hypothetical protein AAGD88_01115 [Bacteroidota bacterium]
MESLDLLNGNLLSYGISGFALIMIGLTYFQIRTELKREKPRPIAIKTIWMFMGLVILSTVVVGFFSIPMANTNSRLRSEVDDLTINMGQLTGLLSQYEYALNELAAKLEGQDNPSTPTPTKPGKFNWGSATMLDKAIIGQHLDLQLLSIPDKIGREQLNDSIRTAILSTAELKLNMATKEGSQ